MSDHDRPDHGVPDPGPTSGPARTPDPALPERDADTARDDEVADTTDDGDAAPAPGQPPPPWGDRWRAILDTAGPGAARRVQRGRGLARRGVVEDLRIAPGVISATVLADRLHPSDVQVTWPLPDDDTWQQVTEALRAELRFLAALLDGRLSDAMAATLESVGIGLLPTLDELTFDCTQDPGGSLCQHVVAVFTTVGARIDRDATVLLQLRGRDRDTLLRELRGDAHDTALADPALDLSRGLAAAHGDLDAIELRPAPVEDPASLLTHLGEPPGVDDLDSLARIIERAAAGAWRLAAGEGSDAADEALLLAELRGQRVASAASLGEALGRDVQSVRTQLDRLFEAGTVMRTGSGDRARYRASS